MNKIYEKLEKELEISDKLHSILGFEKEDIELYIESLDKIQEKIAHDKRSNYSYFITCLPNEFTPTQIENEFIPHVLDENAGSSYLGEFCVKDFLFIVFKKDLLEDIKTQIGAGIMSMILLVVLELVAFLFFGWLGHGGTIFGLSFVLAGKVGSIIYLILGLHTVIKWYRDFRQDYESYKEIKMKYFAYRK